MTSSAIAVFTGISVLLLLYTAVSAQNPSQTSCLQSAEIVFVIDSSYSVRENCPVQSTTSGTPIDNWYLMMDFVSQVVALLPMDSNNRSRVGVLTFSNAVDEKNVIPLGSYSNATQLSERVKALPFVGGNTNMTGALRYANQMLKDFSEKSTASTQVQQIIVLLTDGVNNVDSDPIQLSREIKQSGRRMMIVGVTEYVDDAQLSEMATAPPSYSYIHAQDFSHLNLLVSQLKDRLVCSNPPSAQPCRDTLIDICLLLDASGSINADGTLTNWNLMKGFVGTLISSLPVSIANTHIALIRFSIVADVIFTFDQFYNAQPAVKVISDLPIVGSTTNTAEALETMRTFVFNSSNGARPGVKKIGIVITDGQSNDPDKTSEQAELAKQAGIEMFAIGLTNQINAEELQNIASAPIIDHYWDRTTYALVGTVASQLLWSVCHSACDSSDNSTTTTPASSSSSSPTDSQQQQLLCTNSTTFCGLGSTPVWTAYRGMLLLGLSYATLEYVTSANECQSRCLQDFQCRSVQYISSLQECTISYYTKDDAPPGSFRADSSVDYYQVSCADAK